MFTKFRKAAVAVLVVVGMSVTLAACDSGQPSSTAKDQGAAATQLAGFQTNQPVPTFDWSQLRQNLIEIEAAQAHTTQTTSFFFNVGVKDPIDSCPSIGFPIPSTYQLTNPDQQVGNRDGGYTTIAQIEATGVYTADTTGTYVICVDATGKAYANYWEGYVKTVSGPAVWDATTGKVVLTGAPSAEFTTSK